MPGAEPPLTFERISGGRSNLTYGVNDAGGHRWALRRPPLGKRLASAHDMAREHRIIAALQSTDVPVPPVAGLCEDDSVNGAPFYVMEFVDGPVLRSKAEAEAGFDDAERRAIGERVVDTLVAIHAIDPDQVGLGQLGRKQDYVARQLRRWHEQWEKSKTSELPMVDDVHRRLSERIPEQGPATIVHGDYRLDNMILSPDGEVAAVVDWELCTLGDPLADVGLLLVYWSEAGDEFTPLFEAPDHGLGLSHAPRGPGAILERIRAGSVGDRLLRRARVLEARHRPPGRLRTLRRRPVRRGGRGVRGVREDRRAARRGRATTRRDAWTRPWRARRAAGVPAAV